MSTQEPPYLRVPAYLVPNDSTPAISFEPAPEEDGKKSGRFDDHETKALLGLDDSAPYRISGNYASAELGQEPIVYEMVASAPRHPDFIFLAFVPVLAMHDVTRVVLDNSNGQPHVGAEILRQITTRFNFAIQSALELAHSANISLPEYARRLIPRLRYNSGSDEVAQEPDSFFLQHQPWFSSITIRARIARIVRVAALLEGYCNFVHKLLHPDDGWKFESPVGFTAVVDANEEDVYLRAWARMGVVPSHPNLGSELTSEQLRDQTPSQPSAPLLCLASRSYY